VVDRELSIFEGKGILVIGHPSQIGAEEVLRSFGAQVRSVPDLPAALALAGREEFDLVLLDIAAAGPAAASLSRLRRETSIPLILVLAEPATLRQAIPLLAAGADDYLVKPLDPTEVKARVGRILTWLAGMDRAVLLQKEMTRKYVVGNLISRSDGMRRVRDQILQVAGARSTVLILGESGVGKELVAKAIHYNSPRRDAPFIAINCSAIPVALIESELFGHERGAFTGASARQKGKFELADGGTIFLDEVGEMDLQTQAKLLRVLEERSFMRVGGERELRVDVRVLAATNSDLEAQIASGRFRDDLYFRLKVITIRVPPLRERRDDIPELARALLDQIRRDNGLRRARLTGRALRVLQRYAWPGNVRELKNVLESVAITRPGDRMRESDLPAVLRAGAVTGRGPRLPQAGGSLLEAEREIIRRSLRRHRGNRTHAARALGIGVRTLQRKIKAYGLRVPAGRGRPSVRQRSTDTPSPGLSRSGTT